MIKKEFSIIALLALFIAVFSTGASAAVKDDKLAKVTADLVSATNQYKASVQALIPMYEAALKEATEMAEKRKQLYADGIISKRDLDASGQAVQEAQARLDEARKQLTDSDHLIAEAKAELEEANARARTPAARGGYTATSAIMRSSGSAGWTLARASQVQSFFSSRFGRALPVSAFGQSATHNRMRFNHSNSMDVALHPDSAEGKALIAYLRANGIPFLAFRSAVPGAATGAHIHIGYPSHRMG
jgi:F0F1-type ATP synthase membrane subunit b/b'